MAQHRFISLAASGEAFARRAHWAERRAHGLARGPETTRGTRLSSARVWTRGAAIGLFVFGVCVPGRAGPPAVAELEPGDEPPRWALGARLGYAWFVHSRSLALRHLFKPSTQLSAAYRVMPRLDAGLALGAVLDSNDNYGVRGAYAQGRYLLVDANQFQLGAQLAVGIGHDAPILHQDLRASAAVLPYGSVGLDASWRLTEEGWLGVELANEVLSVVHLGAVVRWRL